jgi:hypothetical protein
VLARCPGLGGARAGHALVLVDPIAAGVARGREEQKLGLKGSSTLSIAFESVEIPRDHVLGELSTGLVHAHRALSWGRTFMAAGCLGTARAALHEATVHTRQREQFGRQLARFPLVSEAIARARAEVFAIESTLRLVCALVDGGFEHSPVASTIVKVLASEGSWSVVDRGLQLMGAAGYLEDGGMARRLRDVRVTRIFEGANDVLRVSLASAALTWPVAQLASLRGLLRAPESLAVEAQAWEATFAKLIHTLEALKKMWGFHLFEQQAIAADLADGIIFVFAALTVIQRASAECGVNQDLARLALAIQLERASASLTRATAPRDVAFAQLLAVAGN